MKISRPYPALTVTPKAEKSLRQGHPWVYAEEITTDVCGLPNGCAADVFSQKGAYLGTGLFSERSKIRIRLLTRNANDRIDEAFFFRRAEYAVRYRRTVMRGGDFDCCRLVFGEADGLPGLTVDRFGDVLVSQVLSYGMDMRRDIIYRALLAALNNAGVSVRGIYERDDADIRTLEGLDKRKGWHGSAPSPEPLTARIEENGILYDVDFVDGQKTGFFLDQKYNRRAVARLAGGMNVLDCFTHTGSFALNAAAAGAAHVTAVDISDTALARARANAALNGLQARMDFVRADVFDLLPELQKGGKYDFVILDPPAFTKNRRTAAHALAGYRQINYRAMKLLPRGGYLATCSCSHFMPDPLFRRAVSEAAAEADVSLRQVFAGTQGPDHPILWNVPQTDYLKFYIFQIV